METLIKTEPLTALKLHALQKKNNFFLVMSEQQRATELSKYSFPARYPFKILIRVYINE